LYKIELFLYICGVREKEKRKIKKLKLPEIINTDLTYYMQFGWKRLKEKSVRRKFYGNTYDDKSRQQDEDKYFSTNN
jgi:hypothetical protein